MPANSAAKMKLRYLCRAFYGGMTTKLAFLVLLACGFALPLRAAFISGVIKNAVPGTPVEFVVPHYYIDGKSDTYRAMVDGQQQFTFEVQMPEPQVAFFALNGERMPLFLEEMDTLFIRVDAFLFPLSAQFGGRAGANNTVLNKYLKESGQDFNDFNNIRYKIGQWWGSMELSATQIMETLGPEAYKARTDSCETAGFALFDDFKSQYPDALTPLFSEWLLADILYRWAYQLIFYGNVYVNRYQIQPEFFNFLHSVPLKSACIGNENYRQFLMALLAHKQARSSQGGNFWSGQYAIAGDILTDKALAFSRSEVISYGFSGDRYRELLPSYNHFLQTNPLSRYDAKVSELYTKLSRVSVGAPAPSFTGTDRQGNTLSLGQFRGNVVYLNFWASWCAACLKKMDFFNDYAPELQKNGIEIINVSIDENPETWKQALAEGQFKGYHLLAASDPNRNIALAYGVEAIPQYFILNRDGTFAEKPGISQPDDIRKKLLALTKNKP